MRCCFCFIPAVSGAIGVTFEGRRTEADETKGGFLSRLFLCTYMQEYELLEVFVFLSFASGVRKEAEYQRRAER